MLTTFRERQDLAKRFEADVARMRKCLDAAGKQVDDDDIVYAWANYSEGAAAYWLTLPETDEALLTIVLLRLPPTGERWYATMLDAGDGSGDIILPLPDKLIAQAGWKQGDTLDITRDESGNVILRRVEEKM